MAKQITEDELNIRRKARRRLIGAIVLTLAVVVILPMILDSEPKTVGQDIDLQIPSPDKVGEFVPGVPASEISEVTPAVEAASSLPDETGKAKTGSASLVVAPDKKPVAAPDPAKEVQGKAQPVVNKTPEPNTASKKVIADGFVAQVGAYSNAAAAKHELEKLRKWGFKAYTEMAGDKMRVRVGPYADRKEAEQILQQLKKRGLNPVVMSVK